MRFIKQSPDRKGGVVIPPDSKRLHIEPGCYRQISHRNWSVVVFKVASFYAAELFESFRPFESWHLGNGLLINCFKAFDNVRVPAAYVILLSRVGFEVEQHYILRPITTNHARISAGPSLFVWSDNSNAVRPPRVHPVFAAFWQPAR